MENFILTEEKYKHIRTSILMYGISVANLAIEKFNDLEMYEESFLITESIKRYCDELHIPPIFESKEHILENYASNFWHFGYSGKFASAKLHLYLNGFIDKVQEVTNFNRIYLVELYERENISLNKRL